jgi:transcriptional regulator with XRE-family HTH domain
MPRPPKHEWPSRVYRGGRSYQRAVAALGGRVRRLRIARGWTLEKAAEAADMDPTQLAKIEAGTINVTLVTLVRIAEGFAVDLPALFSPRFHARSRKAPVRQPRE